MSHYDNQGRRVLGGNPSTWEAEAKALRAQNERFRVALERIHEELESCLDDHFSLLAFYWSVSDQTRAALQEGKT